ncbi:NADH-quinone oxidoreductase subunit E [Oceaniglobus indicus]|uniref:NADH-quinone oxidoreductase subunit E n=1 Tax=Oceaniglobus indicus TaxID=2047749 RepID=UPI000C1A76CF|nr:NADH-quinone oxidoreductase subunit E [Oceaniglobus indicus]
MLRRLHPDQPSSFAFTDANLAWAKGQISKYPEGRQASAVIALLWRAHEQEGWLTRPAIEEIGRMLDLAYIRVLEVATFYFMFKLQPVGSVAHIQICGTTSCMICGAEDLVAVCKAKIAQSPFALSADGKFSWEEVECLGACANAPMAQIGKDYYEDLTAESLGRILDELAAGKVPLPGPQNGRYASEPLAGLTSLKDHHDGRAKYNASVGIATDIGDTIKRIDGTEVPLITPWRDAADTPTPAEAESIRKESDTPKGPEPSANASVDDTGVTKQEAQAKKRGHPEQDDVAPEGETDATKEDAPAPRSAATLAAEGIADEDTRQPQALDAARDGTGDDLKLIKGVGPKLEELLHDLGVWHFDQIAQWSAAEIAWVDRNLDGFKGRVIRDDWVSQAARLAKGEETDFSRRAKY